MTKEIFLAGGCFWGVQHYMKQVMGVMSTQAGYANGKGDCPSYEEVYTDTTGFAETVFVRYDSDEIALATILRLYFRAIDPTSLNKQGEDSGTRYRTGIYYTSIDDLPVIKAVYERVAATYDAPLCVEVTPLKNFFPAEDYHQHYLTKNTGGYCHLSLQLMVEARNYIPINHRIRQALMEHQDAAYREFQAKLMPTIDKERIIGVRTPELRALATVFAKEPDIDDFLLSPPHRYYDENNLHGFIISKCKDYTTAVRHVDMLLPYVDNWATCDLLSPKVFARHKDKILADIRRWMLSEHTFTVRFGIEMLMSHFLDKDFKDDYLLMVAQIRSEEYYVKMMVAWFFATALAKQYEATLPIIERRILPDWTHRKSIQKACESLRLSTEQKNYLRTLK